MDQLYLVVDKGEVFRAFILKIVNYTGLVQVKFIDVGTHGEVEVQKLWAISQYDIQKVTKALVKRYLFCLSKSILFLVSKNSDDTCFGFWM